MWQRIQTLFLVLTILCLVGGILLPFWVGTSASGSTYALYPLHFMARQADGEEIKKTFAYFPYSLTGFFLIASLTLSVMEIRRFDNRLVQMKLGLLNTLILLGAMICAVVFSYRLMNSPDIINGGRDYGLFMIFGAVLFNWLAIRFIRRDEKLVRNSDRLR